ncbi:MAG: flagellar hook-basal body complex protein FliE [Hyphomicrobium sp.]
MSLNVAMLSPGVGRIGGSQSVGGAAPSAASHAAPQADFAQTMASMAADAIATMKTGETTAIAGMQGKAPLQQVVQAVMQADQALRTVVAVRDKVVGAYQEISRMQI